MNFLKKIKEFFTKIYKSRTIWLGVLTTFLASVQADITMFKPVMSDQHFNFLVIGVGILIKVLRYDTEKSIK